MYRIEDLEKINKNIDRIKDEAEKEYKTYYEPTLKEIGLVYDAIKNYIKKTKKIVYGGFAQNILLMSKNPDESFYKIVDGAFYNWPDVADMEFYSSSPLSDIIDLTEELHKQGFKYVEGKEGVHSGTYKIFVNFINYCDISYIPNNIYNNLPVIDIDGIKCVHPHFMLVDAYRVLTDPMTSYWRLDKSIKRFQKILKYYPIQSDCLNKIELKSSPDILKFIRKKIIHTSKLIVVGFYAYDYYVKKESRNNILQNHPYYEIISSELEKDGKNIFKILSHKFGDKIKTKEYYPFFSFIDKKIEYYYDTHLILRLFGNNERCIVYNYSEKKHTHFGTFNLVLLYLFFDYYYYYINKDKFNIDLYHSLICKFFYSRNKYLDFHKITVLDKSPFQDFTYKCYGIPVNPIRCSLLECLEKKKNK